MELADPRSARTLVRAEVRVVEHWWNGERDRLARYDLRLLECGGRWRVSAQRGGIGAGVWESRVFEQEWAARALLDRLKAKRSTSDGRKLSWKDFSKLRSDAPRPR